MCFFTFRQKNPRDYNVHVIKYNHWKFRQYPQEILTIRKTRTPVFYNEIYNIAITVIVNTIIVGKHTCKNLRKEHHYERVICYDMKVPVININSHYVAYIITVDIPQL